MSGIKVEPRYTDGVQRLRITNGADSVTIYVSELNDGLHITVATGLAVFYDSPTSMPLVRLQSLSVGPQPHDYDAPAGAGESVEAYRG